MAIYTKDVKNKLIASMRESIELLGNEVLCKVRSDKFVSGKYITADTLSTQTLRFLYRILFICFVQSHTELGYNLCGKADFLYETAEDKEEYYYSAKLLQLFDKIYYGSTEALGEITAFTTQIFDPELTDLLNGCLIPNAVMRRIIDRMTKDDKGKAIDYAALSLNRIGEIYESLLNYQGLITSEELYCVRRPGETEIYFIPESEKSEYTEEELIRDENGYKKIPAWRFVYRLAGQEREKSASFYTPESLTSSLVRYALKELLRNKKAEDVLSVTLCEPAMGSAAFLNEAIDQLARAYIAKSGEPESKLAYVKTYIAENNVYGIDLNPMAVEVASVSLGLNTLRYGKPSWFTGKLLCGDSIVGARRSVFRTEDLLSGKYVSVTPNRILPRRNRSVKKQVYSFLVGNPAMANVGDADVRRYAEKDYSLFKVWNKAFHAPYEEYEVEILLRLSAVIDELWQRQYEILKKIKKQLAESSSAKEKEYLYKKFYLTEEMQNAGPYARLKFAMDYWCALWFWPIDKAELLPDRNRFLLDMSLILEGNMSTLNSENSNAEQLTIFPSAMEKTVNAVYETYRDMPAVDIDTLCNVNPRLRIVREVSSRCRFFHWELEYTDIFRDKGGFDLILGNPPWIKVVWSERDSLSKFRPLFAVKNYSASEVTAHKDEMLADPTVRKNYLADLREVSARQNFLSAAENYPELKGQQTNLYKCFLPNAWNYTNRDGYSAFLHPNGVYEDANGALLKKSLYPRLRKHFRFTNELKLFPEVHHCVKFSINIYGKETGDTFDMIANLFAASTIDECYRSRSTTPVPGIKENGKWNLKGNHARIVPVTASDLLVFAQIFGDSNDTSECKLPSLHCKQFKDVLLRFANSPVTLSRLDGLFCSQMWNETGAQKDGTIVRKPNVPETLRGVILSGPHIGVSDPFYKTAKAVCRLNSDFISVDHNTLSQNFLPRCVYAPKDEATYEQRIPCSEDGKRYDEDYRLVARKMLNLSTARTLYSAVIPPFAGHTNGLIGFRFAQRKQLVTASGLFASLPYDFFIRITGKTNLYEDNAGKLPFLDHPLYGDAIRMRALLLNALTADYAPLWSDCFAESYTKDGWTKSDHRLRPEKFTSCTPIWTADVPLRTEYERRQALLELDVLVALSLGMTLDDLCAVYSTQFPVLYEYESDTWYDKKGNVAFSPNRGMTNIPFSRAEWEVADKTPYDLCDRLADYATAWNVFCERFGK